MIDTVPRDPDLLAHLRVPAVPSSLRVVRRVVRECALIAGTDQAWADDLVLAVDEACQNVVRHAYGGRGDGDVIVILRRCREGIGVDIVDFAPTVDPVTVKGRDLDDVRPGGLGVHLIRAVCEEAGFMPPPSGAGNLFRLVKRFAKRSA